MRFRSFLAVALAAVMTLTNVDISVNAYGAAENSTTYVSERGVYYNDRAYYAGDFFAENGIQYSVRGDKTLEVLGAVDKQTIATADIAPEIEGVIVTSIADNAFNGCINLRSVNIPDSILEIGEGAFSGCSSLADLNFGKSVTVIRAYAFYGCSALTELTLPDSLTTCEQQAFDHCTGLKTATIPQNLTGIEDSGIFAYCSGLKEINVDAANKYYCSENGILFTKDKSCLVEYPSGKKGISYTVPGSVEHLGSLSFAGCTSLENVILPNGISEISFAAFSWSSALKTVTVPRSVTTISSYAFFACNKLTSICFAGTTEQWSEIYIKEYNDSLVNAKINCSFSNITSSITDNGVIYALKSNGTLEVLGAADKQTIATADIAPEIEGVIVTSIADNAFNGCINLRSVNIPDSILEIGEGAFSGCSSLADLNFGKSVTVIRAYAFYGCSALTELTLPDSLTTCEQQAFDHCTGLKTATIPQNLTGIEDSGIFAYCSGLKEINVDAANKYYCSENGILFTKDKSCLVEYPSGKKGISYTVPGSVEHLGSLSFAGCTSPENVILPNGISEISFAAFSWSSIKALTLPKSIQNISQYALFGCARLTDIYYLGTKSEWASVYVNTYNDSLSAAKFHFGSVDFSGNINQNGIIYALSSDDTLTVIRAADNQSIISADIAAEINGKRVTGIANNAFKGCKKLRSVNIPGSISHIGGAAFLGCSSLSVLSLGEGVEKIDTHAFYGCSALQNLLLPDSVNTIGQQAFDHCTGLVSVTIPKNLTGIDNSGIFAYCSCLTEINVHSDNPAYCSENGVLFSRDKTILVEYPIGKNDSFYSIPKSVKTLGNYAFAGCSKLQTVIIPYGVTQISRAAFAYCAGLKNVALSSSISEIKLYAFFNCIQLSDIFFNGTENQWNSITVENNNDALNCITVHYGDIKPRDEIFKDGIRYFLDDNCLLHVLGAADPDAITSVNITDEIDGITVTSIAAAAFKNCIKISSVNIPGTVEKIGGSAFLGCSSLVNLSIGEGVKIIDDYAFYGCSALKTLLLPESLTTLNLKPFDHCSGLSSVTIPKNVRNIEGSGVFAYCAGLTEINVSAENPYYCSIDGVLFSKDMRCLLEYPAGRRSVSYSIPSTVSSFGYFAFAGCGVLETIVIPDGFVEIEFAAFSWCGGLREITIPSSVVKIDRFGFNNCNRLTDIYYAGTEEQWNSIEVDCYKHGNSSNDAIYQAVVHYNSRREHSNAIALQSSKPIYVIDIYDTYALVDKLCA